MANKYYKVLIQFRGGMPVTRSSLLNVFGITKDLVDSAEKQGYIQQTTPTDVGDIRYVITEKGKEKRDN